jgi:lipopolysaccharide biosynthesis glycosyltransferase
MGRRASRCFALIASRSDTEYIRRGTLTTIRSIKLVHPDVPIVVLHHDLEPQQQALFADVTLKQVAREDFMLSGWSRLSRPDIPDTCYLAVCVEHIEEFDVAIYIDSDAVVVEPLDDLFALDHPLAARLMDDYPLVEHFEDGERLLAQEQIEPGYAVNNGLVRFDLRYWRAHSLIAEARALFAKYGPDTFRLTDQSMLNLVGYKTRTLAPVSRLYNFCRYPDMLLGEHSLVKNRCGWTTPKIAEGLAKVVHWTGPLKPWHPDVQLLEDPATEMCLECYTQFIDGPGSPARAAQ